MFTHKDNLQTQQTADTVVENSPQGLLDVLKKNNNRWLAFNNNDPDGNEPEQLIEKVEIMLACNEGRHYRDTGYDQITKRLKAYGCGTIAEMHVEAEKNPWVLLSIIGILTGTGALGFGFGWLGSLIAYALVFFKLIFVKFIYEKIMGHIV